MMVSVFTRFHRYCFLKTNLSSICNRKTCQSLVKPYYVPPFQGKEEDMEYPLTKMEAISYIENVLKVPNPSERMLENPIQLLSEIQKQTKCFIPFTNVVHVVGEGLNTLTNCKKSIWKKEGGTCFPINTFTRAVLQHLGYDAYLIGGSLPKNRSLMFDAHFGIIVQNLTFKGSFHLVEPGTIHPILDPIPLNFTKASPVYQLISYPIKLFKDGPGIFKLCKPAPEQKESKITDDFFLEDGTKWKCLITYRILQPLTLPYCLHMAQRMATDSTLAPDMHKELIIFGFSEGKLINIKGQQFLQYSHDGSPVITKLDSDKVVDTIHKHFPQYSPKYLEQVHQHFTAITTNQKG